MRFITDNKKIWGQNVAVLCNLDHVMIKSTDQVVPRYNRQRI